MCPQETIEKTDAQGKLLPEMILICQNLRNNLQHPNEYIRGVTLRFLCRIHEEELLEPLVPSGEGGRRLVVCDWASWRLGEQGEQADGQQRWETRLMAGPLKGCQCCRWPRDLLAACCAGPPAPAVIANLDHRHSYVRKNAVLALTAIYKLPKGELLVPDAPELVERMLQNEQVRGGGRVRVTRGWPRQGLEQCTGATRSLVLAARRSMRLVCCSRCAEPGCLHPPPAHPAPQDLSTRRNAFHMLAEHATDKAVTYMFQQIDRVADWGDILQIAVLDLIRKVGAGWKPQAGGHCLLLSLIHI